MTGEVVTTTEQYMENKASLLPDNVSSCGSSFSARMTFAASLQSSGDRVT